MAAFDPFAVLDDTTTFLESAGIVQSASSAPKGPDSETLGGRDSVSSPGGALRPASSQDPMDADTGASEWFYHDTFIADVVADFRAEHQDVNEATAADLSKHFGKDLYRDQIHVKRTWDVKSASASADGEQSSYRVNITADTPYKNPASDRGSETQSLDSITPSQSRSQIINMDEDDRQEQIFFTSWGLPGGRDVPKSQPRTVIMTGFPSTTSSQMITSLVYHGAIEQLRFSPTDGRAYVVFISGDAAKKYYDVTANGVMYNKPNEPRFVVMIDIGKDNEPVSSRLRQQLNFGATRVVALKNCPTEYTRMALGKIAVDKGGDLECLVNKGVQASGGRDVDIRFLDIEAAVKFASSIRRDEDFMAATVDFAEDPCAIAIGPHYD